MSAPRHPGSPVLWEDITLIPMSPNLLCKARAERRLPCSLLFSSQGTVTQAAVEFFAMSQKMMESPPSFVGAEVCSIEAFEDQDPRAAVLTGRLHFGPNQRGEQSTQSHNLSGLCSCQAGRPTRACSGATASHLWMPAEGLAREKRRVSSEFFRYTIRSCRAPSASRWGGASGVRQGLRIVLLSGQAVRLDFGPLRRFRSAAIPRLSAVTPGDTEPRLPTDSFVQTAVGCRPSPRFSYNLPFS